MENNTALLITGAIASFLVAFAVLIWIFYDSNRQGISATLYKTVATALAVLTLPGVFLALSSELRATDPNTSNVLIALSFAAGVLALLTLVLYALRVGMQPAGQLACPSCGQWLNPTWDRCPYCGYTFGVPTVVSPPTGGMTAGSVGSAEPAQPMAVGPAAAVMSEEARKTRVMRARPGPFAWLVIVNGPQKGRELEMTDDLLIGRDSERCDEVLEDDAVSEMHARIRQGDGEFVIHDLGSTNGTFVNGEQVYKKPLKEKDRVQLGETEMVLMMVGVEGGSQQEAS
jgi:hypothetical protein